MIRVPAVLALLTCAVHAQIPAFPGAEGFGAYANGGRGGDVYVVTNLNSSGPGSFYEGITTVPTNGRTVVFAVSGQIRLASGVGTRITANKLTIAGQTAPGDGILLKDGTLRISGDDIVIRHLRFRHGKNGSGGDCINLDSGCQNAILDHLSMSFSTDENISSFGSPPENLTMQWTFNAWGLVPHSCGGLWDQNRATCHHTLWAHNHTRNPKARPNTLLEWTNNTTFDWNIGFIMGDSQTPASWKANVRGNYFICPPGNIRNTPLEKASLDRNGYPNFSVWQDNNLHDRDGDGILNGTDRGWSIVSGTAYNATTNPTGNYLRLAAPVAGSALLNIDPPLLGYKKLVSNGGALRTDVAYSGTLRDEVDTRLVQNVTTQTRNHITRESDLTGVSNGGFGTFSASPAPVDSDKDGMPDFYETALGWNAATQDHNIPVTGATFFPAGYPAAYTRLEEYLHFKSIPNGTVPRNITGSPTSLQIDLAKFTAGFSSSPVFTVSNVTGGSVLLSGTGNRIATFTPTLNLTGRARFDFTVTDSASHMWTQTCAIVVTNSGLPRDLRWKGAGNSWDTTTPSNWLRPSNNTTVAYSDGDRVTFDPSGAAQPNVSVNGTLAPSTVDVDSTGNYTLSGTGAVNSTGTLTKRGAGALNITHAQTYLGGTSLESGSISISGTGSLSGGSISMLEGTTLTNAYPAGNTATFAAGITVPEGNTATFNSGNRLSLNGPLTGGGVWNCNVQTSVSRCDFKGATAAFAGRLNFLGSGGTRLFFNGGSFNGFDASWIDIGGSVSLQPQTNSGGNTFNIATLSGSSAGANLAGGAGGGAAAFIVGSGNNTTSFAGTITGNATFTKTGTGTLTLAGASTYTGATTVSQGGLLVDGSLGSGAVTVSSAALLGGDGTIGGSVTANAGAILSPGTIPFTGATLNITGGLALNGNTIYCDMSNTPAGANDRISVGGSLALTGTQFFQFLLLQGPLTAGTYDLITATGSSANSVSLTHNLPAETRQTFSLARSAAGSNPSKVWLTVTGNPATLTWTGITSGVWDTVTANNWTGASPNTFYNNDAVTLNDSASNRSVSLTGTLAPRSVEITTTLGYTLTGSGAIGGNASLVKNGSGTLTLSNTAANPFTGGLVLNAGTLTLANDTLNANGLGTGTATLNGGTLSMFNNDNTYNAFNANLVVPSGATARINADSRVDVNGTLSGAGILNFYIPWVRTTLFSNWSAFTGTINVLTDSSGGDLRMGTSYSYPGFPNALVSLTDKVWCYYDGTLAEGAGTTIPIGALSGTSQSVLQGGATGGRALTYRIGGKNTDATYAGTISERNTGTATNYVKTGTGIWTLTGSGLWNGGTVVEQGTLKLTGSFACAGATQLQNTATLRIEGGAYTTEAIQLATGATLSGWGIITSDLNVSGTLDGRGFSSGTPGTLAVTGNLYLGADSLTRLRAGASGDRIDVTGDLALDGTLQASLAPGTGFGRYRLLSATGEISGSMDLTGITPSTTAHLSTSAPGGLDLVIDDSDEDGLPDSWEISNFGNLSQTPGMDRDSDGTSNLAEYRLNLNPNSGSSAFRATVSGRTITWPSAQGITFTVKRSLSLVQSSWVYLGSVVGGSGNTASFTDSASFPKAFYRIEFVP